MKYSEAFAWENRTLTRQKGFSGQMDMQAQGELPFAARVGGLDCVSAWFAACGNEKGAV